MFGGDNTSSVQAVSQNVYKSFGIPSSLANGESAVRNEFTIDSIFAKFPGVTEDMKSIQG